MPIYYVENFFSGFGAPLTARTPRRWRERLDILLGDGLRDNRGRTTDVRRCPSRRAALRALFRRKHRCAGGRRHPPVGCGTDYRVRAFYDTFGEDSPTFSVLGPISTGRGQKTVRVSDDLIYQTDLLWASISEYDATGQTPIMGDAYLSIQQVVPGPNNSGYVDIGVNIDNASEDLTYRVTVFGVWKDY